MCARDEPVLPRPATAVGLRYMSAVCSIRGCDSAVYARAWCPKHYERWRRHGDPLMTLRPRGVPCSVPDCWRPHYGRGWCHAHYERWRKHGTVEDRKPMRLPGQPGPARTYCNGYVRRRFPEHPNADRQGNVWEHVMIMVDHLGRPLFPDETVHHVNGVKDDNRLENLELWSSSHPSGQRVADKLAWAQEMLRRYGAF